MAEYLIQDTTLDAIADAINDKTGGSSAMTPAQMVTAIGTISGGGGGITKIGEYTQTEAWTTDALGNTQNFRNTYLPASFSDGIYIANILNNESSGYYASQLIVSVKVIGANETYIYPRRYSGLGTASFSNGTSFYVKAGAVVKIYFIAKEFLA